MSGRSATVEPGDGEMTVPPVLQPVLDIFSPIVNLMNPPALVQDTWFDFALLTASGAQVAQVQNFATLAAGRWEITITHSFRFTGTSLPGNGGYISLNDPDAGAELISSFQFITGMNGDRVLELPILLTRPGWFLSQTLSATQIGDFSANSVSVHARRIF